MKYDIAIIGSGPGGYVAAIRAAQLGMKVAVIERSEVGGICLNWGCIPTKALLKSASVIKTAKEAKKFGVNAENISHDFNKIIKRSRTIAGQMSKGVDFLFQKNEITLIKGYGKLVDKETISVEGNDEITEVKASHIILATGARSRQLPSLKIDGQKIIGYREALALEKQPESMLVVGSGAIGVELAFFYATLGTKVTVVELLDRVVPLEDEDSSVEIESSLKKSRIKVLTSSLVESVDISGEKCISTIKSGDKIEQIESEIVLSAIGISPNTENLGLAELGIETDRGFVKVDEFYRTNVKNIYAIGDIIPTPALAHVASAEGIACVEKIAGHDVKPINYNQIPSGIFTDPEVGSVGMTEKQATEKGYQVKVGKFPMSALGKATAIGERNGFVKLIFNQEDDKLLGAHIVGHSGTDMIAELVVAMKTGATSKDILHSIHPHPTTSEGIMEAAAAANNEAIHI
ncbi:MAG: dihydrolipoyl dehydrogenase [Bacteroidales bacterium]|nr:dihydrolipoyl dehydrogenase [Bacteroidales bacterium]